MTGKKLLYEIDRREYYDRKHLEHLELVSCWWYVTQLIITGCGIVYIAKQFMILWRGMCF